MEPSLSAPLATWYKWVAKHKRGEAVVTVAGVPVRMERLLKAWNKIPYGDSTARAGFVDHNLAPLMVKPGATVEQPRAQSGHDTASVVRSMCILKTFKLKSKMECTIKALKKLRGAGAPLSFTLQTAPGSSSSWRIVAKCSRKQACSR